MKKLNLLMLLCSLVLLVGCENKKNENLKRISTIDSTLQTKVDSILQGKLKELNALSGQAIVMEVRTGEIKAMVGLERKDSIYVPYEYPAQPSGLANTASMLAALETGKVSLSDTVDTGDGTYQVADRTLLDHNWHRGGYGELSVMEGLMYGSNIATYKAMEKAFDNPHDCFDLLDKMSYGKPDTGIGELKPAHFVTPSDEGWSDTAFAWFSIGYNQLITPIQILTFYNAIANNGIMVQPQLYKDSTIVINPQIASRANIDSMRYALCSVVTDGLGKLARSEKVLVAGKTGTIQVSENEDDSVGKMKTEFATEFCGFFPVDNPKYSIIVTINKMGYPASGGAMAAPVFKGIVDCIVAE